MKKALVLAIIGMVSISNISYGFNRPHYTEELEPTENTESIGDTGVNVTIDHKGTTQIINVVNRDHGGHKLLIMDFVDSLGRTSTGGSTCELRSDELQELAPHDKKVRFVFKNCDADIVGLQLNDGIYTSYYETFGE